MGFTPKWTAEMDAILAQGRKAGKSFAMIAIELGNGMTTNAVIGRESRMRDIARIAAERYEFRPTPAPKERILIDRRRPDGLCSDGCGKTAQKGYLHGRCSECNAGTLARKAG